jgi:subtilisin family serine protease/subtilisin-like proprotein convertase family protein
VIYKQLERNMNKKMFTLSAIQAVLVLSLAGCDDDAPKDIEPTAENVVINSAKQWVPVTGTLLGEDLDGDALTYSFTEDGATIASSNGIYTFSHGLLTLSGDQFSYISTTGEATSIDYTVTANDKTASAVIDITEVATDPLAVQQWHLRNTGQKAYSLSDEMKQGLIDLTVGYGNGTEEEQTAYYDTLFAELELSELVAGEDMNVTAAYALGVTGEGVTAVVVDSGLEINHEDLTDNVVPNRSLNLIDGSTQVTDPTSTDNDGDHGTSVAGLIAAKGWNDIGTRGVAPDTGLIGMNYLSGETNIEQEELLVHGFPGSGISESEEISAFNRSYGITFPTYIGYSVLDETIESYPNLYLRSGKGALNVKSSGNSFGGGSSEGSLCEDNGANDLGLTCYNGAFEPSQAHPYYMSIAAVNANGTHTSYSTAGANVMVSAPSGEYGRYSPAMVTTDQMTCINGYSGFNGSTIAAWSAAYGEEFTASQFPFNYPGHEDNASCNYTSTFNGTSSAAPNASGVVSLILSANTDLTWRDVRHILAATSTKNDAEDEAVELTIGDGSFVAHQGWVENAAGYNFNNLYGFGRVDAGAAVEMAKSYAVDLGEQTITDWQGMGSVIDGETALSLDIPDNDATGLVQTIEVTDELTIEGMQFKFDISNVDMGFGLADGTQTSAGNDLAIEVTSPAGTKSVLLSSKQALFYPAYSFTEGWHVGYVLKEAVFLSNAFYGESAQGTWSIRLLDAGETNITLSDGGANGLAVTGISNNASDSVLEGISLRTFGH